ncbi:unnamed protein product [Paramecium primaurelia]|uniref:Transmembrane protein n=1 Tax=Paramecium primaurelia TaxID=5886 RepID=A0A8S1MBT8_PARPR|nr:unnamed protein product [Paramecium primaurelia]
MIRKIIIWFKNLRMSNQIIILNFIIILFAVFATIATAYIQQAIFFTYIQEFEQTLSLKQEKNIVNNISKKLRIYIHNFKFMAFSINGLLIYSILIRLLDQCQLILRLY